VAQYTGYGAVLQVHDGGDPGTFVNIGQVRELSGPSFSLDTAEATVMAGSGWKEYLPTLRDGGEVSLTVAFDPTLATHDASTGLLSLLVSGTKRRFKLLFPSPLTVSWTFEGYVTSFEPSFPIDDVMTADITIKVTGQPTLA